MYWKSGDVMECREMCRDVCRAVELDASGGSTLPSLLELSSEMSAEMSALLFLQLEGSRTARRAVVRPPVGRLKMSSESSEMSALLFLQLEGSRTARRAVVRQPAGRLKMGGMAAPACGRWIILPEHFRDVFHFQDVQILSFSVWSGSLGRSRRAGRGGEGRITGFTAPYP